MNIMEIVQLKLYLIIIVLCIYSLECYTQSSVTEEGKQINNATLTFNCPFKDPKNTNKNTNESENWHNFLNNLYCKFSEYKIQILTRNSRLNYTESFGKQDCNIEEFIHEVRKIEIDENNVESFLNKTANCNITTFDSIENNVVTGVKTEELNHVINITLKDSLHVNCEETVMYIKGNYITTSDVRDILLLKKNVGDKKCKNLLASDKRKFVNVFALNTFFIDVNLSSSIMNSHRIVLLSVIAPKWESIGKVKIDLKGEDAGISGVGNGLDGKPGKPGSPGGNFFGLGREFVNGINLEISVNGGNGKSGQEGKNGEIGIDGDTPRQSDVFCDDNLCTTDPKFRNFFNCNVVKCDFDCQQSDYHSSYCNQVVRGCTYVVFGKTGEKGQNGGNGGKGGNGGYPGSIELIELKNYSQIYFQKIAGKNGVDGKGGAGGLGGRKGSDVTLKCSRGFGPIRYWSVIDTKHNNERAASGQNGKDGDNFNLIENPEFPFVIHNVDKAKIINHYKSYLREKLHDHFKSLLLNVFLNEIESDTRVQKLYNTLGFIDELQQLEEQFHTLKTDINFLPFYQSILDRISEYAKTPEETGDLEQYKKVLCYLYTATLGRIYNMQDNMESNLIINIYAYLSSVKNDVDKLTDLKNTKYKESLINKYKNKYKHEIDIKINESQELILNEIAPKIEDIGKEIESEVHLLVDEVIYLQEQTDKEYNALLEKQEQLENTLVLQATFFVFRIFGDVVSFLGPAGRVAGSVIETGSTVAENFLSDDVDSQVKIFDVPQGVSELQSINDRLKIIINQRIACLNNSLQGISLEIIKHPDVLSNLSFKILSIKDRLDKLDNNKLNFKEIQDLEDELDVTMQMQEEKLDPKNLNQLAVIENLKKIVQLSTMLADSYSKYKNNGAKLDAIFRSIKQNEEKSKMLKEYRKNIYSYIMPMLRNVQNDLQNIMSKLGTKSKVALDVTKWHVQSSLRNTMLIMRQLTRGLKVEENLTRSLEKLEEAMNTLINVYEHIQDYQKDQNLASYIAKTNSIAVSDIIIANHEILQETLRHAVRNLDITVRSNIVLQRYNVAMNAFKMYAFPFAHEYFKDLVLPSHLVIDDKGNTTLDNLVSKAAVEIEKINSKLEDYKNIVTNRDGCIGGGGFQSGYVSGRPFFIWKNKQHRSMISKLLSGDVVIVKADVKNSSPYKDAIKFNIAQFNFTSKNETLQSEINDKLKGFQLTSYHLGNSYYRYENKIYEMMTASREIWYHFEKKENGEPYEYSISYKKIKEGNVTLSPYSSWKVKLDNVTDDISFNDLEIYKDFVDLTLEGNGYFLNKKSGNCVDLMVEKYYKAIGMYYYEYPNTEFYVVDNSYEFQNTSSQVLPLEKNIQKFDKNDFNNSE